MPSGDRKDRSSSHRKNHSGGSSPRGHRHKASDSGIGSLSDQDSTAANPDRGFAAMHGYMSQPPSIPLLQQQLDHCHAEISHLKAELYDRDQDLAKLQEDNQYLLRDNKTLNDQNNDLTKENKDLTSKNNKLKAALDESKRNLDQMNSALDQESDNERNARLRERFEPKASKRTSSRTRRGSVADSLGTGRPYVTVETPSGSSHPPNSSRSQTSYPGSSGRGPSINIPASTHTTRNTPRTPQTPTFSTGYTDAQYHEGGDYVHKPLPSRERNYRP